MLSDEVFVHAFETMTLPVEQFDHAAHVRAGWWYLRRYPIGEAIDRFGRSLRAFATAHGAAAKYHETITVVWMLLVAERLAVSAELPWSAFAARHLDLFDKALLDLYYTTETLQSDRARRGFVMPDRLARRKA